MEGYTKELNSENNLESKGESNQQNEQNNNQKQIAGAIILAGIIIAGAVLLKGNTPPPTSALGNAEVQNNAATNITMAKIGPEDRTLGNPNAKVALVLYEDFQCPFCGRFENDSEQKIRASYLQDGRVRLVYRDFTFLGLESTRAAEAARCAGDQNKFWEYHDFLYSHQNGENKGAFSDINLKSFANNLGLNTSSFNQCFDTNKYAKAVSDSTAEGGTAGVIGTPKGFIITEKDIPAKTQNAIIKAFNPPNQPPAVSFYTTKNIMSLNGALPSSMVLTILDMLLK